MIEGRELGFRYRGGDWVFRDLGFRVRQGEVAAILGPNGRGKTTLLKCAVGLLRPTAGRLVVDGSVGYVPQAAGSPFPYRALDMVLMGRARHIGFLSSPKKADVEAAHAAMARLHVLDLAERPFDRLSGGQQQLLLIARALASECEVLILDEPGASLDFRNQALVMRALAGVVADAGLTVLFTTHSPQHALAVADSALMMFGPTDHRWGSMTELATDAQLEELYGVPVRNISFEHGTRTIRTVSPVLL